MAICYQASMRAKGRRLFGGTRLGLALAAFLVLPASCGPQLNPADPIGFFTNLASRLLKMEMNLDLNRIQIYPTNHYTPAVHRLLQVSANIYEATTNRFNDEYPHLPTLFRPRFTSVGGIVFITGYVEETNSAFLGNTLRDLISTNVANAVQPDDLILGIPIVIGAKKGLPNFNEFASEAVVQITRKVELVKSGAGGASMIFQTNQMLVIGISNSFGAEFWNSYVSNYPRPVTVEVTNFYAVALTNDYNFKTNTTMLPAPGGQVTLNLWPKYPALPTVGGTSFAVPLRSNHIVLADSVYRQGSDSFVPLTDTFERPSGFAFPRWGLTITNRIRAIIKDSSTGQIIDYVQLNGMTSYRDLTTEIVVAPPGSNHLGGFGFLWATNAPDPGQPLRLGDFPGVYQQVIVSGGEEWGFPPADNWRNNGINQPSGATRDQAIANFLAFFENGGTHLYQPSTGGSFLGTNYGLAATVPFTPTKKFSIQMFWQASDPLVHYLSRDLEDLEMIATKVAWIPPLLTTNTVANLGKLNRRYKPWGGYPLVMPVGEEANLAFNFAIKDPGVRRSDNWQFPTNYLPTLEWLGRVHRGTPWQTLYLKSADIEDSTWRSWTGNASASDAQHSKPKRDWPLVALITSLLNTNNPYELLSINSRDMNAWLAALDGISVLTNSASDDDLINNGSGWFDLLTMTMTSSSPQAAVIEQAIRSARAAQPGHFFRDLGDLLAVPELSSASPWLNRSSTVQLQLGITDEAYEKIPAQLLARLRPDSVGTITPDGAGWRVHFTGFDGFPYIVEKSSNLVNWQPISTNLPADGAFQVWVPAGVGSGFYRSVLLP